MKFPGNFGEIFEQAQKLQANMEELKNELKDITVDGSAGGGMVNVKVNGAFQIVELKIDEVTVTDVEMLQDLIVAATNEALNKAKDLAKEEMKKLAGGLPIPGL